MVITWEERGSYSVMDIISLKWFIPNSIVSGCHRNRLLYTVDNSVRIRALNIGILCMYRHKTTTLILEPHFDMACRVRTVVHLNALTVHNALCSINFTFLRTT